MNEDRQEKRRTWKKEVSAGGIVFQKQDGRDFVLLIMPNKKDPKDQHFTPVWSFPKGWVGDHGPETFEEAALREVREEGGVNCKILNRLADSNFFIKFQGNDIAKTVHWFLMEYESGDPKDHDKETKDARWFPADQAEHFLTYKGDKEVFKEALEKRVKA